MLTWEVQLNACIQGISVMIDGFAIILFTVLTIRLVHYFKHFVCAWIGTRNTYKCTLSCVSAQVINFLKSPDINFYHGCIERYNLNQRHKPGNKREHPVWWRSELPKSHRECWSLWYWRTLTAGPTAVPPPWEKIDVGPIYIWPAFFLATFLWFV